MKVRLIKETLPEGRVRFFTEKFVDGNWYYLSGSIFGSLVEARKFYDKCVEHNGETVTEVLEESP
jgi:hypothetical protein